MFILNDVKLTVTVFVWSALVRKSQFFFLVPSPHTKTINLQ